jgi:hypothetical protein
MKVLILDIERFPLIVERWGLRDITPVGINQIVERDRTCAVGMKWRGDKRTHFFSEFHQDDWVQQSYDMMGEADVWVGYNSKGFDVPHLHTLFDLAGLPPLAPTKQVDLYRVAKQFRHPSNKLDYIGQALELGKKMPTGGNDLWRACRAGDPRAWAKFKRYCVQDVRLTEALLDRWEGWIQNPPNANLYSGDDVVRCVSCGSADLQQRGTVVALAQTYTRFVCIRCGKWGRGTEIVRRAAGLRNA